MEQDICYGKLWWQLDTIKRPHATNITIDPLINSQIKNKHNYDKRLWMVAGDLGTFTKVVLETWNVFIYRLKPRICYEGRKCNLYEPGRCSVFVSW